MNTPNDQNLTLFIGLCLQDEADRKAAIEKEKEEWNKKREARNLEEMQIIKIAYRSIIPEPLWTYATPIIKRQVHEREAEIDTWIAPMDRRATYLVIKAPSLAPIQINLNYSMDIEPGKIDGISVWLNDERSTTVSLHSDKSWSQVISIARQVWEENQYIEARRQAAIKAQEIKQSRILVREERAHRILDLAVDLVTEALDEACRRDEESHEDITK